MSLSDFPVSYMSDVRVLTFSDRSADADNTRISRFPCMECPGMHRVFDSARPSSDSRYRRPTRGLPPHATGSAPRSCDFGAQYLACPSPDQRFTPGVTAKGAWPGATVGRYSFHVGLFHPLLHAGFNRRSLRVLVLSLYFQRHSSSSDTRPGLQPDHVAGGHKSRNLILVEVGNCLANSGQEKLTKI